jgi:hypothetical protein
MYIKKMLLFNLFSDILIASFYFFYYNYYTPQVTIFTTETSKNMLKYMEESTKENVVTSLPLDFLEAVGG